MGGGSPARDLGTRQKDTALVQRRNTLEKQRPAPSNLPKGPVQVFDYQDPDEAEYFSRRDRNVVPDWGQSTRDRSSIPVGAAGAAAATKLGRSPSNKLKKDPPGDPWLHRRVDAEAKYQDIAQPRPSVSNQQDRGISRDVTERKNRQNSVDRDVDVSPVSPVEQSREINYDSEEDTNAKPARRLSKIERLTGQRLPSEVLRPQPQNVQATETVKPMDLLPPPPSQVDGEGLAPEYVDPLAGLPKVGRDGRTLFVRPVEDLEEGKDLSKLESNEGLFEAERSNFDGASERKCSKPHYDGEKAGKYKEVRGFRLHTEHGATFWRFNLEIELRNKQQRIAYRINRGPATGFWVPARGEAMNIMFHSCNGFSYGTDPNPFNGPDPLWRDVLNNHQTQPFHVMLGGGDQIYNDAIMEETVLFKEWTRIKDPHHKEQVPFTPELQQEIESFYMNRYCMWFSQGLFGLAISQIPMINIYDDHDIIDGYGSYPDRYMRSPVMRGLGAIAFKYYMLFQHQSSIDEGEETEPQWILAMNPIKALGRAGLLGKNLLNHLDGGVEILDDLDDHWTAKHHKEEPIVNAPPPDTLADVLNKRNKVHHLDADTDEDMIPIFTHDVTEIGAQSRCMILSYHHLPLLKQMEAARLHHLEVAYCGDYLLRRIAISVQGIDQMPPLRHFLVRASLIDVLR
ncbi:hypothetical protein M7I_1781 [Glarea lozoyensis 74030]|uniref:PhoD-like phosphatase domain-containing protein n=1 Tax=Glarea lozoyensis (strain ATCC 74030 / MF5533) TaxID=1104152 RepID=H0EH46_GLAL7|nr:hypothetical protein M7I_1781 [Glarea lozoyensis 74030]